VAAVFWPNVLDASARSSLRTTLATLRRDLDEQDAGSLVTSTREQLGVEPGPEVWIDLIRVEGSFVEPLGWSLIARQRRSTPIPVGG
jgi:DNA-binding SARP family transcriptional activator